MNIPLERDLDSVSVDDWRAASETEREAFIARERAKGIVSFRCLSCGFPTARGVATCEACTPEEIERATARLRELMGGPP